MTTPKKHNTFANVGAMLADGFDTDLQSSETDMVVALDQIEIGAQDRGQDEMETEEQTLADLGKDLRKRQIQAIVIRPNVPGAALPYRLVAGERRVRGALLEGLTTLRARLMTLDDAQAAEVMTAENIHRLNLSQMAEARKLQRMMDELGSVDAVLKALNKEGKGAWLSKRLGLLQLPKQTMRLVTENVLADIETLHTVKAIEKADPTKAKELVDSLKANQGKGNVREQVAAVKAEVKPSKKQQEAKKAEPKSQNAKPSGQSGGTVAAPKDRSQEAPSAGQVFAAVHGNGSEQGGDVAEILDRAFTNISEMGVNPSMVLELMDDAQEEAVGDALRVFYEAGKQSKDTGRAVVQGFRKGQFTAAGGSAFALVAFLHGADSGAKFSLVNILASAKE